MKLVYYILTALLLFSPASFHAQSSTIEIPESHTPIYLHLGVKDTDNVSYLSITISANKRSTRITPRHPVACVPADEQGLVETGFSAELKGMSLDRSRCFFRGTYTANGAPHTLLVFLSLGDGADADPILIVGFHADGTPFKVLEKDELQPAAFEVDPAGGTARFIGGPTLGEVSYGDDACKEPCATSYDPSAAYLIRPDAVAKYDLPATIAYNRKHYVWAGPGTGEQLLVVYNYPGHPKPFAVSEKQAQALFIKLRLEREKRERRQP